MTLNSNRVDPTASAIVARLRTFICQSWIILPSNCLVASPSHRRLELQEWLYQGVHGVCFIFTQRQKKTRQVFGSKILLVFPMTPFKKTHVFPHVFPYDHGQFTHPAAPPRATSKALAAWVVSDLEKLSDKMTIVGDWWFKQQTDDWIWSSYSDDLNWFKTTSFMAKFRGIMFVIYGILPCVFGR